MKRSYRVNYPNSDIKGSVRIVNSPMRRLKKRFKYGISF